MPDRSYPLQSLLRRREMKIPASWSISDHRHFSAHRQLSVPRLLSALQWLSALRQIWLLLSSVPRRHFWGWNFEFSKKVNKGKVSTLFLVDESDDESDELDEELDDGDEIFVSLVKSAKSKETVI